LRSSRRWRSGCAVVRTAQTWRPVRCGRRFGAEWRGAGGGGARGGFRAVAAWRCLLAGDAAGYVAALTGEGLGIAFGGAELLVGCVVAGRPEDYDRQWRRMSRRYRRLTAAVLQASESAPLRSRIVPAAAALPKVFAGIVNQLAE